MTEIYRNSADQKVEIQLPSGVPGAVANLFLNGVAWPNGSNLPATLSSGKFSITLPFAITRKDGEIRVDWVFSIGGQNETISSYVYVVTPVLTLEELKAVVAQKSGETTTAAYETRLKSLEVAVRFSIQAFTGQTFGLYDRAISIKGSGTTSLGLPLPIVTLTSVNGTLAVENGVTLYEITPGGWSIYVPRVEYLEIKEAPPEEYTTGVGGVIYVPNFRKSGFKTGYSYLVEGEWGYTSVPPEIKEAAGILVRDYAGNDQVYRDRYLEAIKASDWNLTFNEGAFRGTGNARADAILSRYVQSGWLII